MILNTKLAFEIWAGIVGLIVMIAFVAAGTLWYGSDITPLIQTQVNNPTPTPTTTPLLSDFAILSASDDISHAISGGTQP